MPRARGPRPPRAEGWFHELENERLEIFLKVVDAKGDTEVKIRASGPVSEMGELIDWFERVTGLAVEVPNTKWRLNRGAKPTPNQMGFDMPQLSSQDATVET